MANTVVLKGNSTDFTHQTQFTGLVDNYCLCQKCCIKPFLSSEAAVQSDKLLQAMSLEATFVEAED